jgi:hypothetical protein
MAKKVAPKKEAADKSKLQKKEVDPQIQNQTDIPPPSPSTYEMFARKKDRGVVSMTEQASMRADATKPRNIEMPKRIQGSIHKIREDQ